MHYFSHCCHAPVLLDFAICTDCKDHCDVMEPCEVCDGTGEVEILDYNRINSCTINPIYKKIECEICHGEGEIKANVFS